eukprot:5464649-Amphidinium_carterae.1
MKWVGLRRYFRGKVAAHGAHSLAEKSKLDLKTQDCGASEHVRGSILLAACRQRQFLNKGKVAGSPAQDAMINTFDFALLCLAWMEVPKAESGSVLRRDFGCDLGAFEMIKRKVSELVDRFNEIAGHKPVVILPHATYLVLLRQLGVGVQTFCHIVRGGNGLGIWRGLWRQSFADNPHCADHKSASAASGKQTRHVAIEHTWHALVTT